MKDREAALTWSEGDATKNPAKKTPPPPSLLRPVQGWRLQWWLCPAAPVSCLIGGISVTGSLFQAPFSALTTWQLGSTFLFFFPLSGRPERPRTASCPGCRQQRLEQLPGSAPGAVEAGGEGLGGEKRNGAGKETSQISWLDADVPPCLRAPSPVVR